MVDATRDSLPPAKPMDATKTLTDLMLREAQSREAQHERADQGKREQAVQDDSK
jgi:hypothetical protein